MFNRMKTLNDTLAHHGYLILATAVFLEAIGLPVPAALAMLIAGAAVAQGVLPGLHTLAVALIAMLAGDVLMFLLGRYTGWYLLGLLCRVSLNPESCIWRSADSFYRRGRTLLLFAKFMPGINTMAPPLAGSMNMRLALFLRLDLVGALLYIGSFFGVGFVFSGAMDAITRAYNAAGQVLTWVVVALLAGYLGFRAWLWIKGRSLAEVAFADPGDVARELAAGAYVYDVRSHGYFDHKATRISGSRRLDPHALHQRSIVVPDKGTVYVYCTCARAATSTRVARELQTMFQEKRILIAVIKGGWRAWVKAGLPVEPVPRAEVVDLPVFE